MRVLQVVPGISPSSGGPSVAITGLARALVSHGVETTLLTTNADGTGWLDVPLDRSVVRDGVTYMFHNVPPFGHRWGFAPSIVRTLRRTVASHDVVHIHWLYGFVAIAAARAAIAAGVPFVVQPAGSLDPYQFQKSRLVKATYLATVARPLLRQAAAIVFTSPLERDLATRHAPCPTWIVPVGLDLPTFVDTPPAGAFRSAFPVVDGPFLLFMGRLDPKKGLDLLIQAFAQIARTRPGLRLVVAGPDAGQYGMEMRHLAAQLGVERRVCFTGILSHALKLAAFIDAELFVLPSYAENFGAVVTEALACGLPVVISNRVNIWPEMAEAEVATVVECSVESVAAGILASLGDPSLRQRIATRGPALVRKAYTWDAIVPGLVTKYAGVAASRSSLESGVR